MTDAMAEPRRIELQVISTSKEDKTEKKLTLVPRFTLALGESTAKTCPEFSFTELMKKYKGGLEPNSEGPFEGEDDITAELHALAKKFEEKYGPKPGKKRKLKCLEDELIDLGDGYDENDPFIDNTEAYDEVVPSCLTTQYGGFYINRGTLDFRPQSDQENSAAEFATPVNRKRGRPRKILDSDEDEQVEGEVEPRKKKIKKKKMKEGMDGEKKRKIKVTVGPDGEKIRQKKIINPDKKKKTSSTVKELLKQQTASTATPVTLNGSIEDHSRENSPSQVDRSVMLDHFEEAAFEGNGDGNEQKFDGPEGAQNQLSPDLPDELVQAITEIKKVAKENKEGKCKFFSPQVNRLLLEIELVSRRLVFGKRTSIYAHLADHLPCGKETLIKRAKKLLENQQDDQLKSPIQRLKEEIEKVMPALQEQHEQEVAKSRQEYKERLEEAGSQKEEGGNTESEEDEKNGSLTEGQSRKGNRDPRKKFKWTAEIRSLLCQIVNIKMHMFDTYKFRNQTAEEYLKTFLENEIKGLWPQGWMQTRMLYKESRGVHGHWTNPPKPKRPVLVPRAVTSPPSSQPSMVTDEQQPADNGSCHPPQLPTKIAALFEAGEIDYLISTPKREKARAVTTLLEIAEDSPQTMPFMGEKLKLSPNSVEAMAAATAAAIVAAVSLPRVELQPAFGDRRPHQVTESLKKGSLDAANASSDLLLSGPRTPPTPLTPQGKDANISPFMAEFNRYLSNQINSCSSHVPTQVRPGPSILVTPTSQLQAKTVSSSTGRPEDKKLSHLPPIQWQVEGLGGADRAKKLAQGVTSLPSSTHKAAPVQSSLSELSDRQAQYQRMAALLMSQDSMEAAPRKSKGDIVRDQVLSQIQAELDLHNIKSGVGSSRLSGESASKRTSSGAQVSARPQVCVATTSSFSRQSFVSAETSKHSLSSVQTSRQSPNSAQSSSGQKSGGAGAVPTARQSPSVVIPCLSPLTVPQQTVVTTAGKQQAVVSPHKVAPSGGGHGSAMIQQRTTSKSSPTTLHAKQPPPPSQISPPSVRSMASVRPLSEPVHKKHSSSPLPPASSPAHPIQPFQLSPNMPTSQPSMKVSVNHGQNMKVSLGQGQGLKVNSQGQISSHQLTSAAPNLIYQPIPTKTTPQGQKNITSVPSPSNTVDISNKPPSASSQGSQKLLSEAPGLGITGPSVGVKVGSSVYQQLKSGSKQSPAANFDQHNRVSPGPRSSASQAASTHTVSQISKLGSKLVSATHSKPSVYNHVSVSSSPRPPVPSTVSGKTQGAASSLAHSGLSSVRPRDSSLNPLAVVSSGLFNHRPIFRPRQSHSTGSLPKDASQPPQGY